LRHAAFLLAFLLVTVAKSEEKPSVVLVPSLSFFVPGLGSYLDGDYIKGSKFFGYFLTGLGISTAAEERIDDFFKSGSLSFHHYQDLARESEIGRHMMKHSETLSLYDSFLSRAKIRKDSGEYTFLPENQNVESISKAPFDFTYLKRPTTYIPFAVAILLGAYTFKRSPEPEGFNARPIDIASPGYTSYVAGTGEEAMFRGWMYPVLYQNTNSPLLSNFTQALVFAAFHGPEAYVQFAGGLYAGWLTERNGFDLGEAVFIHAWWDFWIFAAELARRRTNTQDYTVMLPPFQFSF
jgi:uncharacterized protein